MARAMPVFTGNEFHSRRDPGLARIFLVHFNEEREEERRDRERNRRFDGIFAELRPIGYSLVRWALRYVRNVANLLGVLEKIKEDLWNFRSEWSDNRRVGSWAICYLGLQMWEGFSREVGVEWRAPAMEEFVREVVNKVEMSTWENAEKPVDAFSDWFEGWLARNTLKRSFTEEGYTTEKEEVKGEDKIWKRGKLELRDGITGRWVTNSILQEYQRERKGSDLPEISSLKRLAEGVSKVHGIPLDLLLDDEGRRVKKVRFGEETKRAVFIPMTGGLEE
jgi:hypothetical protein